MSETELERASRVDPGESSLGRAWRFLLIAVAVQAVASLLWLPRFELVENRELRGWLFTFLAMTAGLHLLTVVLLKQILAHVAGARYRPYCWLRWILAEGVAVFGSVLAVLGSAPLWTVGFFALAALLFLLERPTPTDRALFVQQFR